MSTNPNGFFEIAYADGLGLADAKTGDLTVFTTDPSQRILFGCGEGTTSAMTVAPGGITLSSSLIMNRMAISNLSVLDAVVASKFTTTATSMSIQSFNGPLSTSSIGRTLMNVTNPSSTTGAFEFAISGDEAMRISANGFVGIGTPYPASTLDVNGAISLNSIEFISKTRSMSNVASLDVEGGASFSHGSVVVDPLSKTLQVKAPFQTQLGASLSVAGPASMTNGLVVQGGDFRVSDSLRVDSSTGFTGIKNNNPRSALDVGGTVTSGVGSLGPTLLVISPLGFSDVPHRGYLMLDGTIEPGNPGSSKTFFSSGLLGADLSGENAHWSRVRFIIRGVLMAGDIIGNPTSTMAIHVWRYGMYTAATAPFPLPNAGMDSGYRYYITPWVTYYDIDMHYALYHTANDEISSFRICSVHMQFGSPL